MTVYQDGAQRSVRAVIKKEVLPDDDPDLSYLEQDYEDVDDPEERERYKREDRERLNNYGRTWAMVGVRAKATLTIPYGNGTSILQTISSPGLWGIESDSEESYFDEVYADEVEILKDMLSALREHDLVIEEK